MCSCHACVRIVYQIHSRLTPVEAPPIAVTLRSQKVQQECEKWGKTGHRCGMYSPTTHTAIKETKMKLKTWGSPWSPGNENANPHMEELQVGWNNNAKTSDSLHFLLCHGEGSLPATNWARASSKLSRFQVVGLLQVLYQLIKDLWATTLSSPPGWSLWWCTSYLQIPDQSKLQMLYQKV